MDRGLAIQLFTTVILQFFFLSRVDAGPGLQFIENKNQWDRDVDFGIKIPGGTMHITAQGFRYYLLDEEKMEELHDQTHGMTDEATGARIGKENINGHFVTMDWLGSNASTPVPFNKLKTYYNYFIGADPARWASKAFAYGGVVYPALYDGIDLKVYSSGYNLKYDFVVSAGADPCQIKGTYDGADAVWLDSNGNLFVKTSVGELIEKRPYAYQIIHGVETPVLCAFDLEGNTVSFIFPEGYDTCEPLIIDPLLIFSTYSGSTADNWGSTATPGERGNLYSSGVTNAAGGGTFPATTGAFQKSYGGVYDVGILKYDSTGTQLLYASYLGGNQSESPHSLVMNNNEELLVLGTTSSYNFPTTVNAIDTSFNGGNQVTHVVTYNNGSDIFVARISKDGSQLLSSTFLGGSNNDGLNPPFGPLTRNYGDELRGDIITDKDDNVYISSVTASADFPVTNSFDTLYGGGSTDALLLKLTPDLSQIIWGALIGGTGTDASHTLKLDSNGDIFIAGGTTSADFPITTGSYQDLYAGNADGWIAHIAGDGTGINEATFTGTSSFDQIYFLDMNENEEIYVYGQTTADSTAFPITPGVYNNPNSGQFVQKFTNDLSSLIFSTVFGSGRGIPDISPTAFLVNECNNLYMSGWGGEVNSRTGHWNSNTIGMPLTSDAFQTTSSGSDFYFIVLTDDASEFLYATYLGGRSSRTHVDGGTSRFDKGGIVYHAVCSGCAAFNALNAPTSDFPTTPGAWSRFNRSQNCNNAAFKFDLSSLRARLQTNSVQLDMPGLNKVCIPDKIVFQNRCTGGETFVWDLGDSTKIVTPDTAALVHQYMNTGRYLVKLKAIDPGTCKVSDSTSTYVDVFIKQSQVQDDDALCAGTIYELKAKGGVLYEWTSEHDAFVADSTVASANPDDVVKVPVNPADTTSYFIRITEASGCFHRDTVQLNVIPSLVPEFDIRTEGTCEGRPSVHVIDRTENSKDAHLTFDFGDGASTDVPDVIHAYEQDGLYAVKLTGVREFCVYEMEVPFACYKMKIPNIITPGIDDGLNDEFVIKFGEQEDILTPADFGIKVSLTVYNRWGKEVYQSEDYQYDWSGQGLETGIYYYEVTVGEQATCKSWVHLVK